MSNGNGGSAAGWTFDLDMSVGSMPSMEASKFGDSLAGDAISPPNDALGMGNGAIGIPSFFKGGDKKITSPPSEATPSPQSKTGKAGGSGAVAEAGGATPIIEGVSEAMEKTDAAKVPGLALGAPSGASDQGYRFDPSYHEWYYSQDPRDERAPVPLGPGVGGKKKAVETSPTKSNVPTLTAGSHADTIQRLKDQEAKQATVEAVIPLPGFTLPTPNSAADVKINPAASGGTSALQRFHAEVPKNDGNGSNNGNDALAWDRVLKRWTIKEVAGEIFAFACDQDGIRVVQRLLDDPFAFTAIFTELQPVLGMLVCHGYGNYCIQRMIQLGYVTHRQAIVAVLRDRAATIAADTYGCRVFQRVLECCLGGTAAHGPGLEASGSSGTFGNSNSFNLDASLGESGSMRGGRGGNGRGGRGGGGRGGRGGNSSQDSGTILSAAGLPPQIPSPTPNVVPGASVTSGDGASKSSDALVEAVLSLLKELDGSIPTLVADQNGNHVVQKILDRAPPLHFDTAFIIRAFIGRHKELGMHSYGCRVAQKILETCGDGSRARKALANQGQTSSPHAIVVEALSAIDAFVSDILEHSHELVSDQFGNYVIQPLIVNGEKDTRSRVFTALNGIFATLAMQKFSSNVAEKMFVVGTEGERAVLVKQLVAPAAPPPIVALMRDRFANYVVQRVIELATPDQKEALTACITPHVAHIRETTFGYHILQRLERIGWLPSGSSDGSRMKQEQAGNRALGGRPLDKLNLSGSGADNIRTEDSQGSLHSPGVPGVRSPSGGLNIAAREFSITKAQAAVARIGSPVSVGLGADRVGSPSGSPVKHTSGSPGGASSASPRPTLGATLSASGFPAGLTAGLTPGVGGVLGGATAANPNAYAQAQLAAAYGVPAGLSAGLPGALPGGGAAQALLAAQQAAAASAALRSGKAPETPGLTPAQLQAVQQQQAIQQQFAHAQALQQQAAAAQQQLVAHQQLMAAQQAMASHSAAPAGLFGGMDPATLAQLTKSVPTPEFEDPAISSKGAAVTAVKSGASSSSNNTATTGEAGPVTTAASATSEQAPTESPVPGPAAGATPVSKSPPQEGAFLSQFGSLPPAQQALALQYAAMMQAQSQTQ